MSSEEKLREDLEKLVSASNNSEGARHALAWLFPQAEAQLKTYISHGQSDHRERWRRRRISIREFSPQYFRLDPNPDIWTRSEIERILSSDSPRGVFAKVEERLSRSAEDDRPSLRRNFLLELDRAFDERRPFSQEWMDAIVEAAPIYLRARDADESGLFSIENSDRLLWIIVHALEGLDGDTRAQRVLEALNNTSDISTLCEVVRTISGDANPDGSTSTHDSASFGDRVEDVRAKIIERIEELAGDGQIWSQARPEFIIWFWWGCYREAEVRTFIQQTLETPVGLRNLLELPVGLVRSSAGNYERVNISVWSRLVDLELLASKARDLRQLGSAEDRDLAERFLKALEKGKESKF